MLCEYGTLAFCSMILQKSARNVQDGQAGGAHTAEQHRLLEVAQMQKLDPKTMKDWEIAEAAEAGMKPVKQLAAGAGPGGRRSSFPTATTWPSWTT